jgi:hypothetical protein
MQGDMTSGRGATRIAAERDAALSATVLSCVPLFYSGGADPLQDRPAYVRAGSSLAWLGDRLALIQDDANFLALIEPGTHHVDAVALPADEQGRRQFDDLRGTKHLKLDLEACTVIPTPTGERLLAFGSGSTPLRERILLFTASGSPPVTVVDAPALYAALRRQTLFSGSEMNIEGAVLVNGSVRLFNRGNGARAGKLEPVNATCDLPWEALDAYLRSPAECSPPVPDRVVQYDLGSHEGLPLTFTDAALTSWGLVYSATAEDSPDATRDGVVAGSALGVIVPEGQTRWIELRNADGSLFSGKAEGLCEVRHDPTRLYLVIDADDPALPSELCEIELSGPWTST